MDFTGAGISVSQAFVHENAIWYWYSNDFGFDAHKCISMCDGLAWNECIPLRAQGSRPWEEVILGSLPPAPYL